MTHTDIVTDKLGRAIEVKTLTAMDQLDLLEAAQNNAGYAQWFALASVVFCGLAVDDVPLPAPRKPSDFRKNIDVLKTAGVEAICEYIKTNKDQEVEEVMIETVKNS